MGDGNVGKTMFWVAIILGVLIAAGIIFMNKFSGSEIKIVNVSRDALLTGAEFSLEQGDKFVVNFVDGEHEFVIEEVLKTKVRFREGLVFYVLFEEKNLEFDFDEDGEIDVLIALYNIDEKVVSLKVESPEIVCKEVWECSDWGQCIEGSRGRVCVDQRVCDTEESKPAFSESC